MRTWTSWIFAVALAAGLLVVAGCQTAQEEVDTTEAGAEVEAEHGMPAEETMSEEGEAVALMTDPVCKMQVSGDSEHTAEHEGETYFFCSAECRDQFLDEPGKYIQ